jgi:hypothetical protein
MLLNEQEKGAFRHFLGLLLDADEPEAMLGVLHRLAERKAQAAIRGIMIEPGDTLRGAINGSEAERWGRLAEALAIAQALLDKPRPATGRGGDPYRPAEENGMRSRSFSDGQPPPRAPRRERPAS